MSAWDPNVQVKFNNVLYTGYVDYSINFTRGQTDPYGPPQPGTGSLTLLFLDVPSIPINIGTEVEIWLAGTAGQVVANVGYVSDMSLAPMAYGASGSVWALSVSFTGVMSRMLNQTYNVATDTTSTSKAAVETLLAAVNTSTWAELNASSIWSDIDPTLTWATFDTPAISTFVHTNAGPSVTIQAGNRDVWNDYCELIVGSHGLGYESNDGIVKTYLALTRSVATTIPGSYVLTDVAASNTISTMRNRVTVNDYLGAALAYASDDTSVYDYGIQDGTIDTFLNTALDGSNLAAYIVGGLSDPTMAITSFSIELLNPNLVDADRQTMWTNGARTGWAWNITGLPSALGTADLLVMSYSMNITRNSCTATWATIPYSQFYSSNTWNQVPNSYTWTSYGTAYPTQKWSDL